MAGCRSPKPCGVGSSPTRDAKFFIRVYDNGSRPRSERGSGGSIPPTLTKISRCGVCGNTLGNQSESVLIPCSITRLLNRGNWVRAPAATPMNIVRIV